MNNQRFESVLNKLNKINSEASKNIIESLSPIAPDLANHIIEFAFGDIYQRENLDIKKRQLATIAGLTALGNCQPQLSVHINGALNVGCKSQEIVEVIMQMTIYAGFPNSFNSMLVAKDVFIEREIIKG